MTGPSEPGGIFQRMGIDFRVAALTMIVDSMAFSGDIISAGLLYPVEIGSAIVLGFITYWAQIHWYGDDRVSAIIKALAIALITAIPAPISPIVAGPMGLAGLIYRFRRRLRR